MAGLQSEVPTGLWRRGASDDIEDQIVAGALTKVPTISRAAARMQFAKIEDVLFSVDGPMAASPVAVVQHAAPAEPAPTVAPVEVPDSQMEATNAHLEEASNPHMEDANAQTSAEGETVGEADATIAEALQAENAVENASEQAQPAVAEEAAAAITEPGETGEGGETNETVPAIEPMDSVAAEDDVAAEHIDDASLMADTANGDGAGVGIAAATNEAAVEAAELTEAVQTAATSTARGQSRSFGSQKPPRIIQQHFNMATYKLDDSHGYVEANCRHCAATIKGQRNVTSNFIQHIRRKHPTAFQQFIANQEPRAKRRRVSHPATPGGAVQVARQPGQPSAVADVGDSAMVSPERAPVAVEAREAHSVSPPPPPPPPAHRVRQGPGNGKSNMRERLNPNIVAARIQQAAAVEKHGPDVTLEKALVSPTYRGVVVTQCDFAVHLSLRLKGHVWIKREDLQPTGSSIFRGAFNYIAGTPTSRAGVQVGMPSAPAVALAAQRNGKPCMAYVPRGTPQSVVRALQKAGANVHVAGDSDRESARIALSKAAAMSRTYVDLAGKHLLTGYAEASAGYATLALEILQHLPHADKVFLAAGNALMFSAVSSILQRLGQNVKLIGVRLESPAGAPGDACVDPTGTVPDLAPAATEVSAEDGWVCGRPRPEWSSAAPTEMENQDDGDWKAFVAETVCVSRGEMCAAVQSVFEDCDGAILTPHGALSVAGAVKFYERKPSPHGRYVCVVSDPIRDFSMLREISGNCIRMDPLQHFEVIDSTLRDDANCTALFAAMYAKADNRPRVTHLQYSGRWPFMLGTVVGDREAYAQHLEALGFQTKEISDVPPEDLYCVGGDDGGQAPEDVPVVKYAVRMHEDQNVVLRFLAEPPANAVLRAFSYRKDGSELASCTVRYSVPVERVVELEAELKSRCHSIRKL